MTNSYSNEQPKTKVMQPTSSSYCENPISPQQQQPDLCRQYPAHQSATASVHHPNVTHQGFKDGAAGNYKEMGLTTISSAKMSHSVHSAMNHAVANDQQAPFPSNQQSKLNNNQMTGGNAMKNVQTNLGEPD